MAAQFHRTIASLLNGVKEPDKFWTDGNREQLIRSIRLAVTSVAAGRFNVGGCR